MRTAAIILAVALAGCAPDWMDNGLLVRDGVELHSGTFPRYVTTDGTMSDALAEEAAEWWNDQVGLPLMEYTPLGASDVVVGVGYIPNPDALGRADIDYARDGAILGCVITIASDYAYDRATALQALRHELGHCPLGLDDDPGPPVTVDLRSIMSSPLDSLGEVTDHDREIIEEMYHESL